MNKTILLFGLVLLAGCGTKKQSASESADFRQLDSLSLTSVGKKTVFSWDSLYATYKKETITEITTWSRPDSTGKQHKKQTSETRIVETYDGGRQTDTREVSDSKSETSRQVVTNYTVDKKETIETERRVIPAKAITLLLGILGCFAGWWLYRRFRKGQT